MTGIWAWLVPLLIRLAVSLGVPYVMKKFPGVPAELIQLLEEIAKHIHSSDNPAAALDNVRKAVRECTGTGCAPEPQRS